MWHRNMLANRIMWRLALCSVLVWFTTLGLSAASVQAATPKLARQAMLVLIDHLGYDDLQQMPHLQQFAASGAIGVMNINTGGKRTDANAYATVAIGAPARLSESALLAYDAQETLQDVPASHMYQQLHGGHQNQGVVVLSMPRLLRNQNQRQFAGTPGGIGDVLHGAGLHTAVFGSNDTGTHLWRPATLLTTDSQGRIDYGDVGHRLLATAPERPFGVRTDYAAMWKAFGQVQNQAAFVVFDLGDLYRLDVYRSRLEPERYQVLRQTVLQELDAFVGQLLSKSQANRLVLIAAPQVSKIAADKHEWLAPIILTSGEVAPHTVLTSATTRREGIVSNVDIAPTVLRFLGIAPLQHMIGYPLLGTAKGDAQHIGDLLNSTVWTYTHRNFVLTMVGVWIGLGFFAALVRLIFCIEIPQRLLRGMLWMGLALPLCLYVLPIFRTHGIGEVVGALAATVLLFVAIPFRIFPFCQTLTGGIVWLAAATIAVVLTDIWQGGALSKSSIMSYDPIVGARYYGVGNEYMAVMVGCAVLCYGALRHTCRMYPRVVNGSGVIGGALLTSFFASPILGTNMGGALTVAGTATLCWIGQQPQQRRKWLPATLVFVGALAGSVGLLVWLNQMTATPSHIGAATHQVLTGGAQEMSRILARKLDMFWRAFSTSVWSAVLLLVLAGFAAFLNTPLSRKAAWREEYASLWTVIRALVGGAVVGLLTNDTGISVAAMMLLFAVYPSLMIWLEVERVTKGKLQQVQVAESFATEHAQTLIQEPPMDGEGSLMD